jgi:hypothetical protein
MTRMSDERMSEEEIAMLDKVIKSVVNSILSNEGVDPPVQEDESTNENISQEYWKPTEYLKHVPPAVRRSAGRPKKQRREDGNEATTCGEKFKRTNKERATDGQEQFQGQEGESQPKTQEQFEGQEGQTKDEIPLSQFKPVQEQLLSQKVPNIAETSDHIQKVCLLKD